MRLTPGPHDFAVRVSIARQSTPGGQPKMRKGIPVCFNATAEPAHCFVSAASCSLAKPTKLTRKMLTLKSRSFGQHVQACRTGYMIEDITSYHPRPRCLLASPAITLCTTRSLRQPRFPQAFIVSRDVIGPPVRPQYVFKAGNTQRWIELSQPCDRCPCRLQPPGQRIACGDDS